MLEVMKGNQKGVPNERRRQSLRIQKPDSIAKRPEPRVHKSSKKSKKSRPVREPVRAQSVESLSASDESEREGSEREVINSVLVPTIGEQIMLARIIDEEREYDRQGSPSDTWNYWLNVKQKNIWWKELYELDQAARGVLPKNKDKEKVTFAEGSSSNSGLDSRLQGLEERILEFMGEGFVGLHVTVETKLEALGSRMSHIEKNQRILKRRAKKMEDKLTSIESKVEPSHGEDMDFRQWDYGTYEEKEKANSEKDKANAEQEAGKENDNIENTEQEAERKNDEEGEEKRLMTMLSKRMRKRRKIVRLMSKTRKTRKKKRLEGNNEEEGEEKEAETSDEEKENSEDDEKVEEKVVESEAEGEDDQAEVEGKRIKKKKLKGKSLKPGSKIRRKVESEAREAEIEKGTPTPPRGNQTEGTPTPPRGRTKAMAARRLVTRTMEGEPGKGVEVVAEEACETEEKSRKKVAEEEKKRRGCERSCRGQAGETEGKSRKKVAEEEKKEEEAVKVVEEQAGEVVEEQAGEIVEEYTEEEKQRLIMVVYKEAPSPWIMHRCKENAAVAVPKKSGRPKEITVGADSFHGGEEA
ncbi:hypothetical protein HID58_088386 [Brassica napus]|uniref:DUF287 domain-containing protein n=1 Tax=Brassica napus TaxID=3708 RepID=A0ABQ7XVZ2_BRANA|nr:hypothetical protein HID58_088386 [Brassica napus]